jgi:hypothetical protein
MALSTESQELYILGQLRSLEKGSQLVYHEGPDLGGCSVAIRTLSMLLGGDGKIHLVQKRTAPPTRKGQIHRQNGIGLFKYIAIGR